MDASCLIPLKRESVNLQSGNLSYGISLMLRRPDETIVYDESA